MSRFSRSMSPPGLPRPGFSLLEVILALAILTGAIAVLGEVARLGMRNAQIARDKTQAQLLCESVLAEITAGITPAESVQGASLETVDQAADQPPEWLYSIDRADVDEDGLVAVRVTVTQDPRQKKRPVKCSLVRWILDDALETSTEAEPQEPASETGGDRE